jgi:hypothetical protein
LQTIEILHLICQRDAGVVRRTGWDAIRGGNHATADIADAVGVTRQAAD